MASSNHEVMVILSDGKPVTVIKTRDDRASVSKGNRTPGRNVSLESPCKDDKDNHFATSVKQEKDFSKSKECDEHVELRRLRSENHLLQERISHMEEVVGAEKREKDDCIESLKQQITEMVDSERNSQTRIEHLMSRIEELQNIQDAQPLEPVNLEVQVVQDELVASKMREAEANSSFKELQQKLHHLEKQWQTYVQDTKGVKGGGEVESKSKSKVEVELKEQVMALRMREASLVSDLNEIRQKLMERETQNHIFERQTKRQEIENSKLLEKIVSSEVNEKELNNTIKNLERKLYDLEAKQKEDRVLFKIREAEFCQTAAELKRRIAELEIENQELLTSAQLHNKDQDIKEMENRILELQDEIVQLKLIKSDSIATEEPSPTCIMTESFIGDNTCLQPTNFDSIVDFSDIYISHTKDLEELLGHD